MALTNGDIEVIDLLGGAGALAVAGVVAAVWPAYVYKLRKGVTYSIEYKFASSGTVECDIFLEQGNTPPTSAEESLASVNMAVPDNLVVVADVGDTNLHVITYTPAVTRFLRAKIQGTGSNHASTTLAKLNIAAVKNHE